MLGGFPWGATFSKRPHWRDTSCLYSFFGILSCYGSSMYIVYIPYESIIWALIWICNNMRIVCVCISIVGWFTLTVKLWQMPHAPRLEAPPQPLAWVMNQVPATLKIGEWIQWDGQISAAKYILIAFDWFCAWTHFGHNISGPKVTSFNKSLSKSKLDQIQARLRLVKPFTWRGGACLYHGCARTSAIVKPQETKHAFTKDSQPNASQYNSRNSKEKQINIKQSSNQHQPTGLQKSLSFLGRQRLAGSTVRSPEIRSFTDSLMNEGGW